MGQTNTKDDAVAPAWKATASNVGKGLEVTSAAMAPVVHKSLEVTKEVELSAKHDIQRFLVKRFVEWSINTDQEVDVLVE